MAQTRVTGKTIKTKKIAEVLIAGAVFTALVFLFFKNVIFSDETFVLRDLARYFYPLRGYAFGLVRQGIAPLWNPYIFCGNPLFATLQTAVFYPVSLVYLIGNFDKAFNNFIYVHFALAGIFMYIFLLDRKLSRTASFVGAFSFAFSGYMMAVINLLASLGSVVWVPAALWAFFRARERSGYFWAVLTGVFMVMMFLAGEPAILYATGFIMLFCGLKHLRVLCVIMITFLLLSAFQMIPFLELLARSGRSNIGFDIATKWSVPPYDLLNLVFPCVTEIEGHFRGYWEKQSWLLDYYMGLLPILILPIATIFAKARQKRVVLSILVVSVILSLGRFTPAYRLLFDYFPVFRLSRYPVKYFFLTTFSLSWLCAIGFNYYQNNARTDTRLVRLVKRYLYAALLVGIFVLLFDIFFKDLAEALHKTFLLGLEKTLKDNQNSMPFVGLSFFTIRRSLVFFLVFTLALFLGTKRSVNIKWVSAALVALVIGDLYSATYDINLHYDTAKFKEPTANIEFLQKDRSFFRFMASPATLNYTYKPTKDVYTNLLKGGKEMLYANRMMEFGLYDAFGYESIDRKRMSDVFFLLTSATRNPDDTRVIDMMNIKYIVSPLIFEAKGFELVKKSDLANIYENKNVLPRAYLADKACVIKNSKDICAKFLDRSWDPRAEVVLEEEPTSGSHKPETRSQRPEREGVEIIKYAPNEVMIKANVDAPKFLVLSDSYYPGWKVYVDGMQDKLYVANYIFRAVQLPAGDHVIRFVFDPFSYRLGLFITLLAVALLALGLVARLLLWYNRR